MAYRTALTSCGTNSASVAKPTATMKQSNSRFRPVFSGWKGPCAFLFFNTAKANKEMESVDSISGAPKIAPTPISSFTCTSFVPAIKAKSGTKVSGKAVPTAANNDPVTPSEMPSFSPKCSSALVKTSAAIRITIRNKNNSAKIMTTPQKYIAEFYRISEY